MQLKFYADENFPVYFACMHSWSGNVNSKRTESVPKEQAQQFLEEVIRTVW